MEISEQDRLVAPVYNGLIHDAIDTYLNAEPEGLGPLERSAWRNSYQPVETAALTYKEFMDVALSAERQPLNPMQMAREALRKSGCGDAESANELEVIDALKQEYQRLLKLYADHGVDSSPLQTAWEVVYMTEAYIAGYSRQIDRVAMRLRSATPNGAKPYSALDRWHNVLWVPDEDMHDRTEAFLTQATGIIPLEKFYTDHIRHMKVGNHVDTSSFIGSNAFVTFQEDSTVITYENAARVYGPVFGFILRKLAGNEAHHKRAYRGIHLGLFRAFPDETAIATREVSDTFDMPGKEGIEDYATKAQIIGYVGLFDPAATLRSQRDVINSMARIVEQEDIHFATDEGKQAFEDLVEGKNRGQRSMRFLNKKAEQARERSVAEARTNGGPLPLILGHTVELRLGRNVSDPIFIGYSN